MTRLPTRFVILAWALITFAVLLDVLAACGVFDGTPTGGGMYGP